MSYDASYSRRARRAELAGTIPCARNFQVSFPDQEAALDEGHSAGRLKSCIDQPSPRLAGKVDIPNRAFALQITADCVR